MADFALTAEQKEFRKWVHDFAEKEIRPVASEYDETEEFPWPVVKKAAEIGLYAFDFYILKPIDLSKGAHKVMYEPPNRGNKTWANIARFSGSTNDPASQTDPTILDDNFFLPRGYTIVFSGWDQAAGTSNANFVTTIDLTKAVAHNPDGSTITGPGYDYIVTSAGTFTPASAAG